MPQKHWWPCASSKLIGANQRELGMGGTMLVVARDCVGSMMLVPWVNAPFHPTAVLVKGHIRRHRLRSRDWCIPKVHTKIEPWGKKCPIKGAPPLLKAAVLQQCICPVIGGGSVVVLTSSKSSWGIDVKPCLQRSSFSTSKIGDDAPTTHHMNSRVCPPPSGSSPGYI